MASRSRLELVAWATARATPRRGFWYSRLGETHSLGREYHISSTIHAANTKIFTTKQSFWISQASTTLDKPQYLETRL